MARPVTGKLEPLDDGRWRAGLSEPPPSKKFRVYVFPDERAATSWLETAKAARATRAALPDPGPYQRQRYAPALLPTAVATASADLENFFRAWHEETYEANLQAQPERSAAVLADIDNHIVPFFHGIGIVDVNRVTRRSTIDLARFLSGRKLMFHDYDGPPSPRLRQSTADNVLSILRRVGDAAVAEGLLLINRTKNVQAMGRLGDPAEDSNVGDAPLTLPETAQVARFLSVIHQLALWMERLLGLRQGETFGIRVAHVLDQGRHGLLAVEEQGGRWFAIRDEEDEVQRTQSKDQLKRRASKRVLVIPPILMTLIRIVIEAYHTDPETGEVDVDARLVPGIQRPNESGQGTFGTALRRACESAGFPGRGVTPHHLRRSAASTIAWTPEFGEMAKRRWMGHRAGHDVFGRHYVLDDPSLAPMKGLADGVDEQVRQEVGDLMVPTAARHQWGREHPIRARLAFADGILAFYGWQVEEDEECDPWWSSSRVAAELGIANTTARRMLRGPDGEGGGELDAVKRSWGDRECWFARRSVVEAYRAARENRRDLNGVADELGLSYHEAYGLLESLGMKPETRPGERELHITDDHVDALASELDRVRRLHQRAMRIAEAARVLNKADRTLRGWVERGELDVDPETDSSGARFVTRASVADHLTDDPGATSDATEDTLATATVTELTGLSARQVKDLVRAGVLATKKVGRTAEVTATSLTTWAKGYRPDLLVRLELRT